MPDGRTHTAVNAALMAGSAVTLAALHVKLKSPVVFACFAGGLVGTRLVTPDPDMLHVRTSARRALDFVWWPLLLVSKHSGVGHSWLCGPVIRLAYLALMLGLFGWGAQSVLAGAGAHLSLRWRRLQRSHLNLTAGF